MGRTGFQPPPRVRAKRDRLPIEGHVLDGEAQHFRLSATAHRAESTIRTWLAEGRFPAAYRLHGREWRIPRDDVAAMQREESQRRHRAAAQPREPNIDTGAWRKHLKMLG